MTPFGSERMSGRVATTGVPAIRQTAQCSSSRGAFEHDAWCMVGHTETASMKSTSKTLFINRFMFD
jgi:hypothetical protein